MESAGLGDRTAGVLTRHALAGDSAHTVRRLAPFPDLTARPMPALLNRIRFEDGGAELKTPLSGSAD
ncbi:hypothetical protein [Streptomyces sp. NPDC087859]|uniref:hypothetical protein n=1 Tax=Streptomyces sp. NPDC087859 TaxID=3365812 RepID=UPI003825C887